MAAHPSAGDHGTMWPALPLADWEPTYLTVHRWTQVLGKIRMALTPPANHWWHATLYVGERGLITGPIPNHGHCFSLELSFGDHRLRARCADGEESGFALEPMPVAEFYRRTMAALGTIGVAVRINPAPQEVADTTPLDRDTVHASYDRNAIGRLWRILASVDEVFQQSRWDYLGKQSPSHFFWGAFDLAITRFSGRANPQPPTDRVMGEAYSHEVISHGFWPGGDWPFGERVPEPVFYAYCVPTPEGFATASVRPREAAWNPKMGEFLLPYEAVRTAPDPRAALLEFIRSTYAAGAEAAGWDRSNLERRP
jgi:Family of unknown function (DUF5996)